LSRASDLKALLRGDSPKKSKSPGSGSGSDQKDKATSNKVSMSNKVSEHGSPRNPVKMDVKINLAGLERNKSYFQKS
jgi:hypothetical protein